MTHEDGYCDSCGAEVDAPQLTITGDAICDACLTAPPTPTTPTARKPEARDDGR